MGNGSRRCAKALEMILKITLIRAIGRNCETKSAPRTFGMRVRIAKFSLEMSMRPSTKSLRMCRMPCLILGQKCLKNNTYKPSGPGAVSDFISLMMASNSDSEKVTINMAFSSSETRCLFNQVAGAKPQFRDPAVLSRSR
jgi:hypothetical protein